jgi:tripartite-type tricarboxylate transporter receptor subunit TctC
MTRLTRRSVVVGAALTPFAPYVSRAQTWPSGPIKLMIPFPPGGSVDAVARVAQPGLQQRLGATVVIENRTGASGTVATAAVAKSPPDGNTWLFVFDTHAVNPSLLPGLTFDTEKDLDPVLLIATAPYVVAANNARPFKTLDDIVKAAKAKPKGISYASVGTGSIGHLAMVLLGKQAGIDIVHVPYRGGGPAVNDAIAGHVDLVNGSAALLTPQITSGKLKPIFQMGEKRLPALANVQTIGEAGFPGAQANAWWGVFAPAKTPKPIVDRFATALTESLKEQKIAKLLSESQQMNLIFGNADALRKFNAEQMKIWGTVIRENNIKAG